MKKVKAGNLIRFERYFSIKSEGWIIAIDTKSFIIILIVSVAYIFIFRHFSVAHVLCVCYTPHDDQKLISEFIHIIMQPLSIT